MVTGIDKNDVFRLTELIDPTVKITAPQGVYTDVQEFVYSTVIIEPFQLPCRVNRSVKSRQ